MFWDSVGFPLLSASLFCGALVILAKGTLPNLDWIGVICSENGPVERMSAGLWFMVFCWCMAVAWEPGMYRKVWLALGGMFLLLGLRELDAQRWITGWNLDKLMNFFNPQFPLWERVVVASLMVLPAVAFMSYLVHAGWVYVWKIKTWRIPWSGQLLAGGILLMSSVCLDKLEGYDLSGLGLEEIQPFLMGIEELIEFVLAAFVVSVLWPYWRKTMTESERPS